ncbi:DUF7553 family protein [Halomicrococcus gelatinilyticus]|uniref:DUF7553 family protein n=1 Tax=Halomicrococcus gelatinilyticus TaxID=1702103 RepID=UPI002E1465C5
MADHLQRTRKEIHRATEHVDGEVQDNLQSIDEELQKLAQGSNTGAEFADDEAERFEHVEEKLSGPMDQVDGGEAERALQDARDELDAFRREHDLA